MGNIWSQFISIPTPSLTEKNCPDQTGRVFFVTGGYTGVGLALCKILYSHNASVYIAGRNKTKAAKAISEIDKSSSPGSNGGRVKFVSLDLSDLSTIKPAVEKFLAQEQRLDVLVNNAGVMYPPKGSTNAQGHELQMETNCLGHYLLYRLLRPILLTTASTTTTTTTTTNKSDVRVLWAASVAMHVATPHAHGLVLEPNNNNRPKDLGVEPNYAQTKVGNAFLARECAKRDSDTGIAHVAFNPGNLRTELQRNWSGLDHWFTDTFLLHPSIYGAYTELWAALAPEVSAPNNKSGALPKGIESAISEHGVAAKFVAWCEGETKALM
ncbi:hypothetical protein F5Y17DRAFT_468101 [Xylariaceae sp. FL0594]|nr:hypothetical protein F5Y17DRAFT_468101 [Xylariaceae sp. FL0594]